MVSVPTQLLYHIDAASCSKLVVRHYRVHVHLDGPSRFIYTLLIKSSALDVAVVIEAVILISERPEFEFVPSARLGRHRFVGIVHGKLVVVGEPGFPPHLDSDHEKDANNDYEKKTTDHGGQDHNLALRFLPVPLSAGIVFRVRVV